MEKTQREYYLNEQMKAIQKELGDGEDGRDEMAELEERIVKTKLSKEAREKVEGEVKKLKQRSEEHTSELQSLMRISYAVCCLKTTTTKTGQRSNGDSRQHH